MKNASLVKDLNYNEGKPAVQLMLETNYSKEIRIAMKKGQVMKEHTAPFPIVVEVFRGNITFGVNGESSHDLEAGDLVSLEGKVPHDLKAEEDSIVRLSISKSDNAERVQDTASSS